MPKGKGKVVISPGVTALSCNVCKDGTIFISTTMREMAKLRCGYAVETPLACNNGHRQVLTLIAWPLGWGKIDLNRT